jgi:RecA/RadA recombinase
MPIGPSNVAALRSLLAARFPERTRKSTGTVATGVHSVDEALGGGLPAGRLTELVSASPGTGGQTVIAELLHATRVARQRIALIDAADGFVAEAVPSDVLRHLVWVRAHGASEAFGAADILVRDGNYAVVILDLRGIAERALAKTSATVWHRLRHATEASPSAVLIQTTAALVPTVPRRLVLKETQPLAKRRMLRADLANAIAVEVERTRFDFVEKSA